MYAVPGLLFSSGAPALAFLVPYAHASRVAVIGLLACQIVISLGLAGGLLMFRFWRDPDRVAPDAEGTILSGADGLVLYIREVHALDAPVITKKGRDYRLAELLGARLLDGPMYLVGIEMNILDVHVNRAPISGRAILVQHIPGKFISLRADEAPFTNERATTLIEGQSISVAVVQVASRMIRRIETYLDVGSPVVAGERLGMVKMGSLVALVFPNRSDVRLEVEVGDRVKAGLSVIARFQTVMERSSLEIAEVVGPSRA